MWIKLLLYDAVLYRLLIANLVGILPKGYTLSSLEALNKEGSLNVAFVDLDFLEEVGCFL
jgi:hypothetical protein